MTSPALDVGAFASSVLGFELFEHQAEFLRSPARYRVIVAGRQVGKTDGIATECLFQAATHERFNVLIVSQGESAAVELLARCAAMANRSPALKGSVLDDSRTELLLSNGSTIKAVPASYRQIRGRSIDLLCVDEAAFIDAGIWQAAEPTIAARPGARVILTSTPWGGSDHWFRQLYRQGMDAPDEWVQSFHWTSAASPLVSADLLEFWRRTWPDYKYKTEVLAEWADAVGSYFTEAELEYATADYEVPDLEALRSMERDALPTVGGVDWGQSDANALVTLSPLQDHGLNDARLGDVRPLMVSHIVAESNWAWTRFIDYIVDVCTVLDVQVLASERNGVGAFPTDELWDRVWRSPKFYGGRFGRTIVRPVATDMRRKMSGFSKIKGLLQTDRLVLPRHPELLRQLRGLQFEQLPSGGLRIEVPSNLGHDDLADALMQAVSCVEEKRGLLRGWAVVRPDDMSWSEWNRLTSHPPAPTDDALVATGGGLRLPREAMPDPLVRNLGIYPEGGASGSGW